MQVICHCLFDQEENLTCFPPAALAFHCNFRSYFHAKVAWFLCWDMVRLLLNFPSGGKYKPMGFSSCCSIPSCPLQGCSAAPLLQFVFTGVVMIWPFGEGGGSKLVQSPGNAQRVRSSLTVSSSHNQLALESMFYLALGQPFCPQVICTLIEQSWEQNG